MTDVAKKTKRTKWLLIFLTVIFVGTILLRILIPYIGAPTHLGVTNGQLSSLPNRPNCVSSQTEDPEKKVEPLTYQGTLAEAQKKLKDNLQSLSGCTIKTQNDNYWHLETKTFLMGYTDDTEFYFDDSKKTIHVRSASRIGYSDWGVNRKRVETIRQLFNQ